MSEPALSARVQNLRPTAVNRILAEVRELQAQGRPLFPLMRGEPDFRTPPHIIEAAEKALRAGRTTYPDNRGELNLREAVAAKLQREQGLTYNPATEILITTGATFGIHDALMSLLNEGDEVLLPEPVYDAYLSPILLAGGIPRQIAASIRNGRFTWDPRDLEAACTPRTRIVLLNTPWNPTGTVFTRDELTAIGDIALRHNLILLSDEIYEAITYKGARHLSPAALSPELKDRTIILNSLSKTYAMTGWRVGYCAANARLTQAMFLVLQQSSRGPATFIQDAAAAALNGPRDCVDQMRTEYTARLGQLTAALDGVAGCRVLQPEGGFFAMLDTRALGLPSDDLRRRLLVDHGVVTVNGSAYGPSGEGTLRVSFASGSDNLKKGLSALQQGLTHL